MPKVLDLSDYKAATRKAGAGKACGMNGLEAAYAGILEASLRAGEIVFYKFEALKLRLADKTFYTPDFLVQHRDGSLELVECKGFWRDDARVKIKVAAELFPCFRFTAVQRLTKKQGGGWLGEEIRRRLT